MRPRSALAAAVLLLAATASLGEDAVLSGRSPLASS